MNVAGNKRSPGRQGDGSNQGLEDSARSRRVRIFPASVQIGFCACCGATEGGSYIGTLVLAELPLGASYMGTFVASPKRPLAKSRRNTGAMASSQSCGFSVAHPWLMLW